MRRRSTSILSRYRQRYAALVELDRPFCPWDESEAHLHRPFDNPHDAENTARMGDKAKPSGVGAPTALLFEQVAQYRIIKIKLSISMIAVTAATESTKASLASW